MRKNNILALILYAAALLGLGWLIYFIAHSIQIVAYPHGIEFGEGYSTWISQTLRDGTFDWSFTKPPHITLIYGVIYPYLQGALGATITAGRLVSFAASLAVLFFTYKTAMCLTKRRVIAFIAATLLTAHPVFRDWAVTARCDMLALAFTAAGVYLFVKNDKWNTAYAAILLGLAFFTKQTHLTAAVAIALTLAVTRKTGGLVMFGVTYTLVVAGGLVVAQDATHGYYLTQILALNQTSPAFMDLNGMLHTLTMTFIPSSMAILLCLFYTTDPKMPHRDFAVVWFVVALAINAALISRKGSFTNYGLESIVATSVLVAFVVNWLADHPPMVKQGGFAMPFLLLIPLSITAFGGSFMHTSADYSRSCLEVRALISDATHPVYTENAGVVLEAGKAIYNEPFVFVNLAAAGKWDDGILNRDLMDGNIEYVVLWQPIFENVNETRMTMETAGSIAGHYDLIYNRQNAENGWFNLCVYKYSG